MMLHPLGDLKGILYVTFRVNYVFLAYYIHISFQNYSLVAYSYR